MAKAPDTVRLSPVLSDPKAVRRLLNAAIGVSVATNILGLVQPLFMLHVYDYVLPSQSRSTLVYLTLMAFFLVMVLSALDFLRGRLLAETTLEVDKQVRERAFLGAYHRSLSSGRFGRSSFTGDLDMLRAFATGPAAGALMDLPWTPLYILALMLLSPILGGVAIVFALLVALAVLLNQRVGRLHARQATLHQAASVRQAEDVFQASDAVESMGFSRAALARWSATCSLAAEETDRAAARTGVASSSVRGLRISLQILQLATAAFLVLKGQVTPGAMMAASIIGARALAPVDTFVSSWKAITGALQSWSNVSALVREHDARNAPKTELPPPLGALKVENLTVTDATRTATLIQGVSFEVPAGSFVGVVGASGSGKSTLVRAIAGAAVPAGGVVRIDGADVRQWSREKLGKHLGYLPQQVHLMSGTVSEMIRRLGPVDDLGVVAAAKIAGAHDMVTRLPSGYDTDVGDAGSRLSGGQRARVGMARAFYGDPVMLVLDEPLAHLDSEGEAATWAALREARERKKTVILVAHRPSQLMGFDYIAVMAGGRLVRFGPAKEILPAITAPAAAS